MILIPFLFTLAARLPAPLPVDGIPFDLVSNKPFVQVRVNGSEPLWFILDSGASGGSVLSRDTAKALGLQIHEERRAHVGAGEGERVRIGRVGRITLDIGGRKVAVASAMTLPFNHVAAYEGRRIDGLLGEDIFRRFVVDIDYPGRTLRLHDPDDFRHSGRGASIPIRIGNGFAVVRGEIRLPDGHEVTGDFVIDTGMRATVMLTSPFVRQTRLIRRMSKTFAATVGGGMGGESRGLVGRAEKLRIGPLDFEDPIVILSQDRTGVLGSADIAGIIGGQLLSKYRVIFDYRRERLIFEPARRTVRFEYDRSGMFLTARPPDFDSFEVMSVMTGSPADDAGIKRGDVITAVNGRPGNQITLEDVRSSLRQEGCTQELEMERDGTRQTVKVALRRII